MIVAGYLVDVKSRVDVYSLDGVREGELALPGVGTAAGIAATRRTATALLPFTLAAHARDRLPLRRRTKTQAPFEPPPRRLRRGASTRRRRSSRPRRTGHACRCSSRPARASGLDGSEPDVWLYAYGGFAVSVPPTYSPVRSRPGWRWAASSPCANLRGGGEYGEEWHHAGMKEKKQNVFDDFIAAAEHLVEREGTTSPGKLVIKGGSNGGLLVGAAMTQRPELFAVALPAVGVLDMLRYHRFTGGAAWATEYGSRRRARGTSRTCTPTRRSTT